MSWTGGSRSDFQIATSIKVRHKASIPLLAIAGQQQNLSANLKQ
jgi:hypothetical protein